MGEAEATYRVVHANRSVRQLVEQLYEVMEGGVPEDARISIDGDYLVLTWKLPIKPLPAPQPPPKSPERRALEDTIFGRLNREADIQTNPDARSTFSYPAHLGPLPPDMPAASEFHATERWEWGSGVTVSAMRRIRAVARIMPWWGWLMMAALAAEFLGRIGIRP